MELKKVKELVKIMEGNNISTLELTEGDVKIRLEKGNGNQVSGNVVSTSQEIRTEVVTPLASENISKKSSGIEVKSPMVGVFYKGASPTSEPFVRVGSKVKKGDVLCIIEAMKLMNEIYAEHDGTISEVCLNDGEVAEYSQVLFRMN